jgi:hypothetical protein
VAAKCFPVLFAADKGVPKCNLGTRRKRHRRPAVDGYLDGDHCTRARACAGYFRSA